MPIPGQVKGINSWDICDQVCMNLFEKTPLCWKKIHEWSERKEEFVKRTAFALIACLAWHDKDLKDQEFIKLFPVIKQGATDERNYVKKAVNWVLRNIGERNANLNMADIAAAREIKGMESGRPLDCFRRHQGARERGCPKQTEKASPEMKIKFPWIFIP